MVRWLLQRWPGGTRRAQQPPYAGEVCVLWAPARACVRCSDTGLCFRHEELDRLARERDAVLAAVKGAHAEQLRALEARAQELQARCETLELRLRRAEGGQADALKSRDAAMDK